MYFFYRFGNILLAFMPYLLQIRLHRFIYTHQQHCQPYSALSKLRFFKFSLEIRKKCKDACCDGTRKQIKSIKDYIKAEKNQLKAYHVVNGSVDEPIDL